MMSSHKPNIISRKSFDFAILCINLYKYLCEEKKEYVMSKQLLRSGTSVGANIREAKNAESKMDFVHKLAIAQKECDETIYWLELLKSTNYIDDMIFEKISIPANEILKILKSIILTTKQNINS
ncbi:MAG: four helix bundle protein [Paludibacteraceae bacterium]